MYVIALWVESSALYSIGMKLYTTTSGYKMADTSYSALYRENNDSFPVNHIRINNNHYNKK